MPQSWGRRIGRLSVGQATLAMTVLLAVVGCDVTSSGMAIPRPRPTPGSTAVPQAGVAPPAGAASAAPGSTDAGGLVPASPAPTLPTPASAPAGTPGCAAWPVGADQGPHRRSGRCPCRSRGWLPAGDDRDLARQHEYRGGSAICRKAAEVAFANGVTSISVTAVDARRIATGTPEMGCAGAP